jgi:hypothetical protein
MRVRTAFALALAFALAFPAMGAFVDWLFDGQHDCSNCEPSE